MPVGNVAPAVSVILPTHNRLPLLRRSLASVQGQTLRDIEIIVIDNSCDDGTSDYLKGLDDRRVHVVRLDQKVGASAARNTGLNLARAQLIAFQDDDDIWLPTKLEQQVDALESTPAGVGLCLCGLLRLKPSSVEPRYSSYYFDQIDFAWGVSLRDYSVIATPGWLVRRSALATAGLFDVELPCRNDWELALRLRQCCEFTYIAEPLYLQDQTRESSMMYNGAALSAALQHITRKHGSLWAGNPQVRGSHARTIAKIELRAGNLPQARSWLNQAWRAEPTRLQTVGLLLVSWLPRSLYLAALAVYARRTPHLARGQ